MIDLVEQRAEARKASAVKRGRIAELRKHVQAGRVGVDVLLLEPPALIAHMALVDVMGLARPDRCGPWREGIGRAAVRDGVNVLVPVGKASRVTREWAAAHSPRVSRVVAERRRVFEARARADAAAWDEGVAA